MSRRKNPAAPPKHPQRHFEIEVCCRGRRRHEKVTFGYMLVHLETGVTTERLVVAEYFGGLDYEAGSSRKTIPFVCRRCRPARNVPLKRTTLDEICQRLMAEGAPELDLSALGASDALR